MPQAGRQGGSQSGRSAPFQSHLRCPLANHPLQSDWCSWRLRTTSTLLPPNPCCDHSLHWRVCPPSCLFLTHALFKAYLKCHLSPSLEDLQFLLSIFSVVMIQNYIIY